MTYRITPLLLLGLALAACSPADDQATTDAAQLPAPSPDDSALQAMSNAYLEHYNQQHAAEVADFYSDSAFVLAASQQVVEGKAEVLAALEAEMAGSPTLSLTPRTSMVIGDHAVGIGEYSVHSMAGEQMVTFGGAYLTLFHRENGQWKIGGLITNLGGEPPADFFVEWDENPPPDNGTMKEMIARYVQLYNASDWAGLASMYSDDALVSFSQSPVLEGAAAVRQRFEERFGAGASPKIEIHDVGTMELNPDWAVDGGWYQFSATTASGPVNQGGMYMNLLRRQPDGSWKIHWAVVNGRPMPEAAKSGA